MALVFAELGRDSPVAGRRLSARAGWSQCPSRQRGRGSSERTGGRFGMSEQDGCVEAGEGKLVGRKQS